MNTIVLVSHGKMAEGVKSSLEMIIGKQENVHTVSLKEGEDNNQFEQALQTKMKALNKPIIIIADLLGGTPCNVAVKNYIDETDVSIFSGLSLPLVIECATNPNLVSQELVRVAKEAVLDVKEELTKVKLSEESEKSAVPDDRYSMYAGKAKIVNARIDERLIHGQVAGIWTTSLNTQRIIVANDEAAADPLQKSSLRLAAPSTMRLSVLPVKEAAKNISSGRYGEQRIFLLFKNPADGLRYLEEGGPLSELTVGNMSYKEGSRNITKNIQVLPREEEVFEELSSNGVIITSQVVPNDPAIDFMGKLKNN